MITGFEEITKDLTEYEKDVLLPVICRGMRTKRGIDNAIKSPGIVKALRSQGYKITDARLRKVLHVIRVSGMIKGIVASSKGYYIATKEDEYLNYIKSLKERIAHITSLRAAMIEQYSQEYALPKLNNQ